MEKCEGECTIENAVPQPGSLSLDPISTPRLVTRKCAHHYQWQPLCEEGTCATCNVCLEAAICPCRYAYVQRRRALFQDMNRYQCCYGACACSGHMGEHDHPDICLRSEVLCCFCYANLATRWIIQDQMHVGNTCVDNCITCETLCLRDCISYLACSSNARAGARGHIRRGDAVRVMECMLLHVLAGPMVCCMFPCMAAQQTAMLDMRDANPTIIRPPFDPTKAPTLQVMNAPSRDLNRKCMTHIADGGLKLGCLQ